LTATPLFIEVYSNIYLPRCVNSATRLTERKTLSLKGALRLSAKALITASRWMSCSEGNTKERSKKISFVNGKISLGLLDGAYV